MHLARAQRSRPGRPWFSPHGVRRAAQLTRPAARTASAPSGRRRRRRWRRPGSSRSGRVAAAVDGAQPAAAAPEGRAPPHAPPRWAARPAAPAPPPPPPTPPRDQAVRARAALRHGARRAPPARTPGGTAQTSDSESESELAAQPPLRAAARRTLLAGRADAIMAGRVRVRPANRGTWSVLEGEERGGCDGAWPVLWGGRAYTRSLSSGGDVLPPQVSSIPRPPFPPTVSL
jgi:hypothetical protein